MSEKYTGLSLRELLEKEKQGKLLLPNFQREFVWNRNDQLTLLASFLIDIPIGSILLVEDESGKYATRKLCYNINSEKQNGECQYLLDGQQRLSSLKSFFHDFYNHESWEDTLEEIYHPLRTRWFLKVKPDDNEIDWLGWEYLEWDNEKITILDPQEIFGFIKYEKINPKQTDKWFHPGHREIIYSNLSETDKEYISKNPEAKDSIINDEIARKAAEAGLVPLYDINDQSDDSLHSKTLTKLASRRVDLIESKYKNDPDSLKKIFHKHRDIWSLLGEYDKNKTKITPKWEAIKVKWVENFKHFLENVLNQKIAVIRLGSDEISRAIPVFEYMNKQGTTLSVFDLVIARASFSEDTVLSLREVVNQTLSKEISVNNSTEIDVKDFPEIWNAKNFGIFGDDSINYATQQVFLNLLSLVSNVPYVEKNIDKLKVEDIKTGSCLRLPSEVINDNTSLTLEALIRASIFAQSRLGCIGINDVSYRLMLIPLGYFLKEKTIWHSKKNLDKLEYWWWASLLSDAYRDDKQDRVRGDIISLYKWIENDSENPFESRYKRILNVQYWCDKETLLLNASDDKVHSSIENGMLQYVLSKQPFDFLPKSKFNEYRLKAWELNGTGYITEKGDDEKRYVKANKHHIIPLGSIKELGTNTKKIREDATNPLNSPLNLAYISDISNGIISDRDFSSYKNYLNELSLSSHIIPKIDLDISDGETEVESFLGKRFDSLKDKIKLDLMNLL